MTTIYDLSWWYWFLTVGFLGTGLFGWEAGIPLAIGLSMIQIGHVLWLTGRLESIPVQVRLAYLSFLIAGTWEPIHWIHWIQLAFTTARVAIGYCFLARTLSLAPWNSRQSLSLALLFRTYFSRQSPAPPCGEVFRRMSLKWVQG